MFNSQIRMLIIAKARFQQLLAMLGLSRFQGGAYPTIFKSQNSILVPATELSLRWRVDTTYYYRLHSPGSSWLLGLLGDKKGVMMS